MRNATAMIVLVGLEPPDVANTLPSEQNTLSIWCIRPFPSTTLVIGFTPICIPPMVCRPVGGAVPFREFAVLCAIYSCIGAKAYPVRITRDRIRCRALGYKAPAIMQAEIARRTDGATALSLRQINYTLDALHERKFFARARANERQTFYSHRMGQDELETRLITGKDYSAAFHQRRREHNAEFMARLKQSRRLLK